MLNQLKHSVPATRNSPTHNSTFDFFMIDFGLNSRPYLPSHEAVLTSPVLRVIKCIESAPPVRHSRIVRAPGFVRPGLLPSAPPTRSCRGEPSRLFARCR